MIPKSKGQNINGWLVIDKFVGASSAAIVHRAKKILNAKKAGHGGTLDPLASGLLPIALGEATKTVRYVMDGIKTYKFCIKWGVSTDTDDAEGKTIAVSQNRPSKLEIENILPNFIGDIDQVPPSYSAIKIDGVRAYKLARKNCPVQIPSRVVKVKSLSLIDMPSRDEAVFEIKSGKGTYIRSLARDIGLGLGTVGHLKKLRRTSVGPFIETQAISLDYLDRLGHSAPSSNFFFGVESVLDGIPAIDLRPEEARKLRQGQPVSIFGGTCTKDAKHFSQEDVISAWENGRVFALAKLEGGQIKPYRILNI